LSLAESAHTFTFAAESLHSGAPHATPSAVDENVTIEVDGQAVVCTRGVSLFNAIVNAGRVIGTACGGRGICHLCRVNVIEGEVPEPTGIERRALGNVLLARGVRLACRIPVEGPMRVTLPTTEGPPKAEGKGT
jgi:ferredoxin